MFWSFCMFFVNAYFSTAKEWGAEDGWGTEVSALLSCQRNEVPRYLFHSLYHYVGPDNPGIWLYHSFPLFQPDSLSSHQKKVLLIFYLFISVFAAKGSLIIHKIMSRCVASLHCSTFIHAFYLPVGWKCLLNFQLLMEPYFTAWFCATSQTRRCVFFILSCPSFIWLFVTSRRQFNTWDFSRGVTLELGWNHCAKVVAAPQTDVAKGECGFAERRGFWGEEMKRLPAENGDQSIKDQPQTVWGRRSRGKEENRDTLISVAAALTLMAASSGPVPAAGICFNWITLVFFPLVLEETRKKKSILGEHSMTGTSFQNWSGCQALSFGDFCSPLYF